MSAKNDAIDYCLLNWQRSYNVIAYTDVHIHDQISKYEMEPKTMKTVNTL